MSTLNQVILVNEQDEEVGTMEKIEAHRKAVLHRAFSVFIFNNKGEMLLQQRALTKYHSGGLWTNACCGHPSPGELTANAAARRLQEEMGFTTELNELFNFTYRHAFDNGLTEYEFDHVFAGYWDAPVFPSQEEVNDYCLLSLEEIRNSLNAHPSNLLYGFASYFHAWKPGQEKWLDKYPSRKRINNALVIVHRYPVGHFFRDGSHYLAYP